MKERTAVALVLVGVTATLQGVAWILGIDGQVFALTSAVITGVLGWCIGKAK